MALNPFETLLNNPQYQTQGRSRFLDQGTAGANAGLSDKRLVPFANVMQEPEINLKSSFNNVDNAELEKVGKSVFGTALPDDISDKEFNSMATENSEEVDPKVKPFYDASGDLSKILAGVNKVFGAEKKVKEALTKQLSDAKPTPEKAKKLVRNFFGTDPEKETPAWADAALAIGQSLLSADPNQTGLQSVGLALGEGGKAAKVSKAKGRARTDALNQAAFGVYQADQKRFDSLTTSLAKNNLDSTKYAAKIQNDLFNVLDKIETRKIKKGEFNLKQEKLTLDQKNKVASAVTNVLKVLPEKQRGNALNLVAQNSQTLMNSIDVTDPSDAVSKTLAFLKTKGLDVSNTAEGKDITINESLITTKDQFEALQKKFPKFKFPVFEAGKTYKVEQFFNKQKVAAGGDGAAGLIAISPEVGKQTELTTSVNKLTSLKRELKAADTSPNRISEINTEIGSLEDRIKILTTRGDTTTEVSKLQNELKGKKDSLLKISSAEEVDQTAVKTLEQEISQLESRIKKVVDKPATQAYIFKDGNMVAAGPNVGNAYKQAVALAATTDLAKKSDSLAQAVSVGDQLMRTISSLPVEQQAGGLIANLARNAVSIKSQIKGISTAFGVDASDTQDLYFSGNESAMNQLINGTEIVEGTNLTSGQVFTALDRVTKGNAELNSLLMTYAYSLAGSRETGKLTDADIANSLVTFGGKEISQGDWLTNPKTLIAGINSAISSATNTFAIKYNRLHKPTVNHLMKNEINPTTGKKYTKEEAELKTTFSFQGFVKSNEGINKGLSSRIKLLPGGRLEYQALDEYRGMRGFPPAQLQTSGFSSSQLNLANELRNIPSNADASAIRAILEQYSIEDRTKVLGSIK